MAEQEKPGDSNDAEFAYDEEFYDLLAQVSGETPNTEAIDHLLPSPPPPSTEKFLRDSVEPIGNSEIPGILSEIMAAGQFDREHARRQLTADLIGFVTRKKDGTPATYLEMWDEALEVSGKDGAATWGTITLMGNKAIFYALHFDVVGGSVGVQEADYTKSRFEQPLDVNGLMRQHGQLAV